MQGKRYKPSYILKRLMEEHEEKEKAEVTAAKDAYLSIWATRWQM